MQVFDRWSLLCLIYIPGAHLYMATYLRAEISANWKTRVSPIYDPYMYIVWF